MPIYMLVLTEECIDGAHDAETIALLWDLIDAIEQNDGAAPLHRPCQGLLNGRSISLAKPFLQVGGQRELPVLPSCLGIGGDGKKDWGKDLVPSKPFPNLIGAHGASASDVSRQRALADAGRAEDDAVPGGDQRLADGFAILGLITVAAANPATVTKGGELILESLALMLVKVFHALKTALQITLQLALGPKLAFRVQPRRHVDPVRRK